MAFREAAWLSDGMAVRRGTLGPQIIVGPIWVAVWVPFDPRIALQRVVDILGKPGRIRDVALRVMKFPGR